MTESDRISTLVRDFILKTFPLARRNELSDQDSLLEGGIVDSMGLLEIVNFLETELEIVLTDEEILADNFESIDQIAEFIRNRKNVPSN